MYKNLIPGLLSCIWLLAFSPCKAQVLFDENWRFHRGGAQGAEQTGFNDSGWRKLDLPHDWSIEDRPGNSTPFDADAISQVGGGFTIGGTGWYRKTFDIPAAQKGKRVIILFDGVYMNADVWVNGAYLGNHPYGYTSFYFDLTDHLVFGGRNVIAVEVKNEGQNSRWYSGSGIYRHVWLVTEDPVHIAQWGTCITTSAVQNGAAAIGIKTKILNERSNAGEVTLVTTILDARGRSIAVVSQTKSVPGGGAADFEVQTVVKEARLWSCESPTLYRAVSAWSVDGKPAGQTENKFGIRTLSFDVDHGFRLNGKTVKLKGGCFHNDNGPLGSKAYDRAESRKVELLKAAGFNAIRCSHNPPSPAFLDACDRLGMLVIDEAFDVWNYGKMPYDYHLYFKDWWQRDIQSMVDRDINHPSIILWSIGNEIPERATPGGVKTARMLGDYIRSLDATRAITSAVNGLSEDKDLYFGTLDVGGYNYAVGGEVSKTDLYESDHQRVPGRIMVGTESYPFEAFGSWMSVEDHPYVIGDFVWTAFDYIGEASIGWLGYPQAAAFYPWHLAFCGDLDICGGKRPQSYYRDALWKKDQLSVFVTPPVPSFATNPHKESWSRWNWYDVVADWNWKGYENIPLEVSVYSSCEKVELFLNNRSLGIKPTDRSTQFTATWRVPYRAGELKAVGYSGDKVVNTSMLATADRPASIELTADRKVLRADNEDLCYITVDLVDRKGNINPQAENLVKFSVTGDAKIAGVGNANPLSLESFQQPRRKAWKGKCLVIIKAGRSPGKITVKAQSLGLKASEVTLMEN